MLLNEIIWSLSTDVPDLINKSFSLIRVTSSGDEGGISSRCVCACGCLWCVCVCVCGCVCVSVYPPPSASHMGQYGVFSSKNNFTEKGVLSVNLCVCVCVCVSRCVCLCP